MSADNAKFSPYVKAVCVACFDTFVKKKSETKRHCKKCTGGFGAIKNTAPGPSLGSTINGNKQYAAVCKTNKEVSDEKFHS